VAGAFDGSGAGAVTAYGVGLAGDFGQDGGEDSSPALRGETPYRWRYGRWRSGRSARPRSLGGPGPAGAIAGPCRGPGGGS
jgi:hypothetical protein